jgi:hypothetical protein
VKLPHGWVMSNHGAAVFSRYSAMAAAALGSLNLEARHHGKEILSID